MCWAEHFCFVLPLNLGCVLLGVVNIILSTTTATISVVHFASEKHGLETAIGFDRSPESHLRSVFNLKLNDSSTNILMGVVLLVGILCILTSMLLIIGICRNNSTCVLVYFFFGVTLIILCQLGGLLVLLQSCWGHSLIIFLVSLLYIHFEVAVYTVYELMQRGKDFRFHKFQDDDQLLNIEQ